MRNDSGKYANSIKTNGWLQTEPPLTNYTPRKKVMPAAKNILLQKRTAPASKKKQPLNLNKQRRTEPRAEIKKMKKTEAS